MLTLCYTHKGEGPWHSPSWLYHPCSCHQIQLSYAVQSRYKTCSPQVLQQMRDGANFTASMTLGPDHSIATDRECSVMRREEYFQLPTPPHGGWVMNQAPHDHALRTWSTMLPSLGAAADRENRSHLSRVLKPVRGKARSTQTLEINTVLNENPDHRCQYVLWW